MWLIQPNEVVDLDNLVAALDEENAQDQQVEVELHIKIEKLLQLVTMMTKRRLKSTSFVLEFFF